MSELTQEKVLAMVGRELDSLVAEKVMGLELHDDHKTLYRIDGERSWGAPLWYELPKYSTDISAAWEVMEKFKTHQITYSETRFLHSDQKYRVIVEKNKNVAYSNSAPEAICKAALLAVMGL